VLQAIRENESRTRPALIRLSDIKLVGRDAPGCSLDLPECSTPAISSRAILSSFLVSGEVVIFNFIGGDRTLVGPIVGGRILSAAARGIVALSRITYLESSGIDFPLPWSFSSPKGGAAPPGFGSIIRRGSAECGSHSRVTNLEDSRSLPSVPGMRVIDQRRGSSGVTELNCPMNCRANRWAAFGFKYSRRDCDPATVVMRPKSLPSKGSLRPLKIYPTIAGLIPRLTVTRRALTRDLVAAYDLVQECLPDPSGNAPVGKRGTTAGPWLFTILPINMSASLAAGAPARRSRLQDLPGASQVSPNQHVRLDSSDLDRALAALRRATVGNYLSSD